MAYDDQQFLNDDFFLKSDTARHLYHCHAHSSPVFDYHNHLCAKDIAENRNFENLTQIWLAHDHYKWRLMRQNGIAEEYCSGKAEDVQKFNAFAATLSYSAGNPVHLWSHLELKRYFGITEVLDSQSAPEIYAATAELLRTPDFSARNLLKKMNVHTVCTTDDPTDDLRYHAQIASENSELKVLPTFRPDNVRKTPNAETFNSYIDALGACCGIDIKKYAQLIEALHSRHLFFKQHGCRSSDHGLELISSEPCLPAEAQALFAKIRNRTELTVAEQARFSRALLEELAAMDHEAGWVMQLHIGAMRNTNTQRLAEVGADAGCDSITDASIAQPLARLLDSIHLAGHLPKTVLYNLNPADNELLAAMAGNFATSSAAVQFGPAWWFMDQRDGIKRQLNVCAAFGLLRRFIGMTTDSRSLLSFPRHEYFRRILCNFIGEGVNRGEIPADSKLLCAMVEEMCFTNAQRFFEGK